MQPAAATAKAEREVKTAAPPYKIEMKQEGGERAAAGGRAKGGSQTTGAYCCDNWTNNTNFSLLIVQIGVIIDFAATDYIYYAPSAVDCGFDVVAIKLVKSCGFMGSDSDLLQRYGRFVW